MNKRKPIVGCLPTRLSEYKQICKEHEEMRSRLAKIDRLEKERAKLFDSIEFSLALLDNLCSNFKMSNTEGSAAKGLTHAMQRMLKCIKLDKEIMDAYKEE